MVVDNASCPEDEEKSKEEAKPNLLESIFGAGKRDEKGPFFGRKRQKIAKTAQKLQNAEFLGKIWAKQADFKKNIA